jgi:hypothetical protein
VAGQEVSFVSSATMATREGVVVREFRDGSGVDRVAVKVGEAFYHPRAEDVADLKSRVQDSNLP